jgi:hypothetical protein
MTSPKLQLIAIVISKISDRSVDLWNEAALPKELHAFCFKLSIRCFQIIDPKHNVSESLYRQMIWWIFWIAFNTLAVGKADDVNVEIIFFDQCNLNAGRKPCADFVA